MSPLRIAADILLGAFATVAALSILALAWEALSAGLPYTSTTLVTILVAAVVVVGRGA